MKKYNLFILLPNISDQEIESVKSGISELIKKAGAKIDSIEDFGKRKLSYTIKKIRHGFYLNYMLELELDKIKDLEKELKLTPEILRYELSQYTDKHKKEHQTTQKRLLKNNREEKKVPTQEVGIPTKNIGKKVSMEELNKKLDNILEDNIK